VLRTTIRLSPYLSAPTHSLYPPSILVSPPARAF
jgi:hypothetical protein